MRVKFLVIALLLSFLIGYRWQKSDTVAAFTWYGRGEVQNDRPAVASPLRFDTSQISPQAEKVTATVTPKPSVAMTVVPSSSPPPAKECIGYEALQRLMQEPLSEGWRKFPYSRPSPECRTFNLPAMEELIKKMKGIIKDPDLFRLFENSYPNTLDTMIKWRGFAKVPGADGGEDRVTDEELTYVITGDVRLKVPVFCRGFEWSLSQY